MKIPIKYGLIATVGVAAWVLIMHSLITDPKSAVHTLGAPIFRSIDSGRTRYSNSRSGTTTP